MTIDHYPYKRCSTLETMNLSHLISRDNWTFQSQERRCHVTTLNLGPSFSVEKNQMSRPPSKGTRSNLPLRGWTLQTIFTVNTTTDCLCDAKLWEARFCKGEVGGSKNCSLVQRGVTWRKRPKTQVSLLK